MFQSAWLRKLRSDKSHKEPTPDIEEPPIPYQQILILAIIRLCEPIAFTSIFPYVYHMVESFHITESADQIALYAGMITSSFTFAEFLGSKFWGNVSDRYGRKPVLITGLVGTAISMIMFGLSPNLATAMIARALGGVLNGNLGVIYTMVSEISTKEQQPKVISYIICTWPLGTIIGSALGGALALPCENYPYLFARNTLWDKFPFLLPNLVCVTILVGGIVIGCLFLKETMPDLKHHDLEDQSPKEKIVTYTPQIILLLVAYALLAYHSVSFDQLMPIFLSTPESNDQISLPLKFTGGLGLTTKTIGFMFSVQGVYSLIAQLWGYPLMSKIFGNLRCFRFVLLVWPPVYFLVPYIVLLPAKIQALAVYIPLLFKMSLHVVAFPAVNLLIMHSIPSPRVGATINGTTASIACLSRALGTTFTGMIHAKGLEHGYSILSWWTCGLVCLAGAIQSFWLVPPPSKPSKADSAGAKTSRNPEQQPLLRDSGDDDYRAPSTFSAGTFSQSQDRASYNARNEA